MTEPRRDRPDRSDGRTAAALALTLSWRCDNARHRERLFFPAIEPRRGLLPPGLEPEAIDRPIGHRAERGFAPGELVADYRTDDCLRVADSAFNRRHRRHVHVEPRAGRFYPQGFIAGVRDIRPQARSPFRVGEVDDGLTIDLNHPLAGRELTLGAEFLAPAGGGQTDRLGDPAELITTGGPGMQARWRNRPTDFFSARPFRRDLPQPDADFYRQARLVDHLDRTATTQVEAIYRRLLDPGAEVLDLMSSWKSHLVPDLPLAGVAGLGMNREELDANPRLTERRVQDLNLEPALPYPDARFDAAVCSVSVEYLTSPFEVFAEVHRVLKPGGRFVVTFSNRWFPPKVIDAWRDLHELERPGLVLEYFLRGDGFGELRTESIRGLPRPADDKYADRLTESDPVYAIWGTAVGR